MFLEAAGVYTYGYTWFSSRIHKTDGWMGVLGTWLEMGGVCAQTRGQLLFLIYRKILHNLHPECRSQKSLLDSCSAFVLGIFEGWLHNSRGLARSSPPFVRILPCLRQAFYQPYTNSSKRLIGALVLIQPESLPKEAAKSPPLSQNEGVHRRP